MIKLGRNIFVLNFADINFIVSFLSGLRIQLTLQMVAVSKVYCRNGKEYRLRSDRIPGVAVFTMLEPIAVPIYKLLRCTNVSGSSMSPTK